MVEADRPSSALSDTRPPIFDFDVNIVWLPLKRSAFAIGGIIAACLLAGIMVFLLLEPRYHASATLRIDPAAQRIVGTEDAQHTQPSDSDRFLETALEMARSNAVAEAVMRDLRLSSNADFVNAMGEKTAVGGGAAGPEAIRSATLTILSDNMVAALVPNTRIAAVSFEAPDPELAARVSNSYAKNLVRFDLQQKAGQSAFAREFLDEELVRLRAELADSEKKANTYARRARIVSLPNGASDAKNVTLTSTTLSRINEQMAVATARRIEEETKWRSIARQDVLSIPQVTSNLAVQRLIGDVSEARAALNSAQARRGPIHPEVLQLEAKVKTLNSQLERLTANIKRGLKTGYDSAVQEERQLESRLGSLRSQQLTEQDRSVDLNILERESQTKRDQYEAILARYNDITAEAGAQVSNLTLLDRAEVPKRPYWPSLTVIMIAASGAGLFLALVFVLSRELLFRRIRNADDIRTMLNLPAIGAVQEVPGAIHDALQDHASPLHENYSEALAALLLASPDGIPRSLLVTSASPGDGKTTSAFSLASAMGAAGKRVLLIDGDMRRPSQHYLFDCPNIRGLSTLLSGQDTLASAVHKTSRHNVDLLTSGPLPPQPAELLASGKLDELMTQAQSDYDVVVVDAPPVVGFADPLRLASVVQSVLLVVRADRSRPNKVRVARDKFQQAGVGIVGALLTFYHPSRAEYRDYYSYRSEASGEA